MIQDLLNSPTDGHKTASVLSSLGASAGTLLNTSGNASVVSNRASIGGGAGASSGCGWNDPYIAYPADPCADFPSVALTAVVTTSGTEWYLTLTFTSCICNEWEFSYAQTGPGPVNSGGVTITCSHAPYTYSVRIYPSYSHSPHFIYSYTISASCCVASRSGTATV